MNQKKLIILLFSTILFTNFSCKSLDLLVSAFDPENVRQTARYNIALREEAARKAREDLEYNEEMKRRMEALVNLAKFGICFVGNTLKFGFKLTIDPKKTLSRFVNGKKSEVVIGGIGFFGSVMAAIIWYLKKRDRDRSEYLKKELEERLRQARQDERPSQQPQPPQKPQYYRPGIYPQIDPNLPSFHPASSAPPSSPA